MPVTHRIARLAMALLGASILSSSLRAQSTEADLQARLANRLIYLHGCWDNGKLHFDSTGKLLNKSGQVSITLCGFDPTSVRLENKELVLKGSRVGLALLDNQVKRIKLDKSIQVEIDASAGGDYGPALDNIFAYRLADMTPLLPIYWQGYAQKHFLLSDSLPAQQAAPTMQAPQSRTDAPPKRTSGSITPPRLLKAVEPDLSEAARAMKYGGTTLINLWIEPDGSISHLSLVRPTGMGLDENALAAVSRYKFAPATQDGKPIRVELNIEVNFLIR